MEIWRFKDMGDDFDLLGSRDVVGHVTIRLPGAEFLWVVHIVTMHLSRTVMEIWRLKYWTHGPGHRKKDGRMERERGMGGEGKGKGKYNRKRKGKGKEKRNGRESSCR